MCTVALIVRLGESDCAYLEEVPLVAMTGSTLSCALHALRRIVRAAAEWFVRNAPAGELPRTVVVPDIHV